MCQCVLRGRGYFVITQTYKIAITAKCLRVIINLTVYWKIVCVFDCNYNICNKKGGKALKTGKFTGNVDIGCYK